MSLSSFSLLLGVYFYCVGFPFVFSSRTFISFAKKFLKDEGALRILGFVLAAIAVTTLRRQWVVSGDGEGIIVLLAWLTFLKGLCLAWWPTLMSRLSDRALKNVFASQGVLAFVGFVMVLLGALFTYLGLLLA